MAGLGLCHFACATVATQVMQGMMAAPDLPADAERDEMESLVDT